jgi:hypothetical protein
MKRARSTYEQRVSDAASSLEVIDRFGQVTPEQRQSFYNNLDAACAEFTETMPPQWEAPAACDQFESGRPAVTSKLTKEENRLLNLAMIRQAGQTSERQADLCNIYFRMYGKVWPVECEAIEPPAW